MEEREFETEVENEVDTNDESTGSGKGFLGALAAVTVAVIGGTILYKKVIKPRSEAKKAAKKQLPIDTEYEVLTDDEN